MRHPPNFSTTFFDKFFQEYTQQAGRQDGRKGTFSPRFPPGEEGKAGKSRVSRERQEAERAGQRNTRPGGKGRKDATGRLHGERRKGAGANGARTEHARRPLRTRSEQAAQKSLKGCNETTGGQDENAKKDELKRNKRRPERAQATAKPPKRKRKSEAKNRHFNLPHTRKHAQIRQKIKAQYCI